MKLKSIKLSLCLSILGLVVLSVVSQGYSLALAQTDTTSLVIDDFSSGAHKAVLKSGVDRQIHEGSMVGGQRLVNFIVPENNQYNQLGMFQIRPPDGVLIFSSGYKTFHRIEMAYGIVDLEGHVEPLHLDLSGYDSIQVDFDGNDRGVNFNIVLFSTNGGRAQLGRNVTARDLPFTVDFPLEDFTPVGDFDISDLSVITIVSQSGSAIGSNDYALTEIRAASP